ncbi:MAG TPA: LysE family translocator [bacterium]|nr:LysE family translocator [bacterium]
MTLQNWLAFVVAASVLLAIPGPTLLLVMSYSLAEGRRSAWSTVPGVVAGDATALTLSLLGLGALLAASAAWFAAFKWVGAAYLVYLGVRMWRSDPGAEGMEARWSGRSHWRMTAHAYTVTALNPKSIAFFVAFLPQFLVPHAPLLPQGVLLGSTFLVLAGVNAALYAVLVGGMRSRMTRPHTRRMLNRVGGSVLIGAGALTAALRRAA